VGVYLALMTDEHQAAHPDSAYPDARNELNHWLTVVKWLLAIPHCVVLWQRNLGCLVMLERSKVGPVLAKLSCPRGNIPDPGDGGARQLSTDRLQVDIAERDAAVVVGEAADERPVALDEALVADRHVVAGADHTHPGRARRAPAVPRNVDSALTRCERQMRRLDLDDPRDPCWTCGALRTLRSLRTLVTLRSAVALERSADAGLDLLGARDDVVRRERRPASKRHGEREHGQHERWRDVLAHLAPFR
jgi:hypothetical protein